ncbi:NAD-dependent protein deacylase [Limosilactobacillus ingluviei]|uniref:protein acetyllysine N-acetyltransferase n=1 Tax=Limosilactobacillus ingluviei TaxID=148604 RepID=A0A0R2H0G9_9LACO|nr:NAD-dependent protein deacylase [Limosilactobacillus ingluviei]KRN43989.1 NAD-dependent deacetylase (regulatory protein SIR2 family protein) [Limosilactobacillus ingluviei]
MDAQIQAAFDAAQQIVFLTGAGVSTASGIPDFRSANGLYTKNRNAEYYLSHRYFASDPAGFYQFCKDNLYFPAAQPNVIHQKQAALTQQDRAVVITQNIDGLYEKAQTKHLVNFHGTLERVYCEKCHQTVPVADYLHSRLHAADGGALRPDIVLYDEAIPEAALQQSLAALQAADLVVIVGTSMQVYPFSGLLNYANPAAQILAINQEPLHLPVDFTMLTGDAVAFFAELKI